MEKSEQSAGTQQRKNEMQHWQERHKCGECGREIVLDIVSWGTRHQSVACMVCMECIKDPKFLLEEGKVQEMLFKAAKDSAV